MFSVVVESTGSLRNPPADRLSGGDFWNDASKRKKKTTETILDFLYEATVQIQFYFPEKRYTHTECKLICFKMYCTCSCFVSFLH